MINLKRLLKSFTYAYKGLYKVFREEQNLRVQSISGMIAVIAGVFFRINAIEWAVIILCISIVLIMEVVNSATERVTDVLKPRIDNYVKEIKDIMAAAVLLSSIAAVIIGFIIFLPYLIS